MSYTSIIQSNKPIGYWKLNGTTEDLSVNDNSASVIGSINYSALPLVSNSGSSMIISPNSGSVVIPNKYDAFHQGFERCNFTIEFWVSFDSSIMTGAGFDVNNSSATQYFTNDQLKIIQLLNGSTEVGVIYYDYNKNTFRFKINDSNGQNQEAYFVVRNLNTSFYIVAEYNEKSLSISVNGDFGAPGSVKDFSLFPAVGTSNYNFVISSNSLNPSASMSYIINDLAFYDYKVQTTEMRQKTTWAYHNDKPNLLTTTLNTSMFELEELDSHVIYHTEVLGNNFLENKEIFNLSVDSHEGLVNKNIVEFSLDKSINPFASATFSNDGIYLLNSANLVLQNFSNLFEKNDIFTLTSQVKFGGGDDYIFSFNQKSNNTMYYSKINASGFYFYSYDLNSASITLLNSVSATLSSGSSYNFGICINSGSVNLYGNNTSSTVAINNIKIENGAILNIGNMITNPAIVNTSQIKNVGFSNLIVQDFSTIDFTENKMFLAHLTNDYSVSQIGYWIKTLSLSNLGNRILGSKITWDSMDNVKVEISNNNGFLWYPITRGTPIPYLSASGINKDVLIKVTVPYDYKTEIPQQSFNNLQISIYNDLSFFSKDKNYEFLPQADSSSSQPFTIQRNTQAINYRKDNFGIKFNPESGSSNYVPGYAYIKNLTSAINTYGMDFWFKPNSFNSASNYLVHVDYVVSHFNDYQDTYTDLYSASTADVATTEFYLYVDSSTKKLVYSPSATAKLYVNGNYVTSNSTSVNLRDYYHLLLDFGTASGYDLNSTTIINGLYNTASGHSHFVYGNINMWNRPITSNSASLRYISYVGNNSASISDSSSVIWQQNRYSSASVTASGIKIG